MRPPEFTGGNVSISDWDIPGSFRFNEAAGIHRRKPPRWARSSRPRTIRFNEAAGIHRRKHKRSACTSSVIHGLQ